MLTAIAYSYSICRFVVLKDNYIHVSKNKGYN